MQHASILLLLFYRSRNHTKCLWTTYRATLWTFAKRCSLIMFGFAINCWHRPLLSDNLENVSLMWSLSRHYSLKTWCVTPTGYGKLVTRYNQTCKLYLLLLISVMSVNECACSDVMTFWSVCYDVILICFMAPNINCLIILKTFCIVDSVIVV